MHSNLLLLGKCRTLWGEREQAERERERERELRRLEFLLKPHTMLLCMYYTFVWSHSSWPCSNACLRYILIWLIVS